MPPPLFDPVLLSRLDACPHPTLLAHKGLVYRCNRAAALLFECPDGLWNPPRPLTELLDTPAADIYKLVPFPNTLWTGRIKSEWNGRGYHVDILSERHQALVSYLPRFAEPGDRMPQLMKALNNQLRCQLTTIQANVSHLVNDPLSQNEKAAMHLAGINRSVFALVRLANNLRDNAQWLCGEDYEEPSITDLRALCADVVRYANRAGASNDVTVTFSCPEESLPLSADSVKFARILYNLLSNALLHANKGDRVDVTLKQIEDTVILQVEDRGPGVPAEKMPELFTQQSLMTDNSPTPGLGLPLAAIYAEQHGGGIFIGSSKTGGTIAAVILRCDRETMPPLSSTPVDYTGELPAALVEFADLPGTTPLYRKGIDLDALTEMKG